MRVLPHLLISAALFWASSGCQTAPTPTTAPSALYASDVRAYATTQPSNGLPPKHEFNAEQRHIRGLDAPVADELPVWRKILAERLPLYGHRNWIVIADSAYPAQSRPGIETIVTGADQIEVVEAVMAALNDTRHVTPTIYTDAELKFVSDDDAPGAQAYREKLKRVLVGHDVSVIPHEQVIADLDKAGETFKVLILKTNLTIPYTSVFLKLGCAYWNDDAEQRLREAMK